MSRPTLDKSVVQEILAHLGAAKMQILPTDDQIIAQHIIAAHSLAHALNRSIEA